MVGDGFAKGLKLGIERTKTVLPGEAANTFVDPLGSYLEMDRKKKRKAIASFLVMNQDNTDAEVVGRTSYENNRIDSDEAFEYAATEFFVWCQARFKADCYEMTIE